MSTGFYDRLLFSFRRDIRSFLGEFYEWARRCYRKANDRRGLLGRLFLLGCFFVFNQV